MISKTFRRVACGVALLAAPAFLTAQPGLPPMPGGMPMMKPGAMMPGMSDPLSPLSLVDKPVIQNELDLAEVQLTEIKKMKERQDAELEKLIAEKKAANEKALFEKLLPKQLQRLQEIIVQLKGNRALQEGFVAEKLALTDDQKKKIEQLYDDNAMETQKLFNDVMTGKVPRDSLREKGKQTREKLAADIVGTLTEEQRKTFDGMHGEKAEINPMDLIAPPMGMDGPMLPPNLPPLGGANGGGPALPGAPGAALPFGPPTPEQARP